QAVGRRGHGGQLRDRRPARRWAPRPGRARGGRARVARGLAPDDRVAVLDDRLAATVAGPRAPGHELAAAPLVLLLELDGRGDLVAGPDRALEVELGLGERGRAVGLLLGRGVAARVHGLVAAQGRALEGEGRRP